MTTPARTSWCTPLTLWPTGLSPDRSYSSEPFSVCLPSFTPSPPFLQSAFHCSIGPAFFLTPALSISKVLSFFPKEALPSSTFWVSKAVKALTAKTRHIYTATRLLADKAFRLKQVTYSISTKSMLTQVHYGLLLSPWFCFLLAYTHNLHVYCDSNSLLFAAQQLLCHRECIEAWDVCL